jgi:membrane protein YqaA with SNARE-associated domain
MRTDPAQQQTRPLHGSAGEGAKPEQHHRRRRWIWRSLRRSLLTLHFLETTTWLGARERISSPAYPLTVGVLALVLTVSMTIPFAAVLIGTILLRRDRWREIVLLSSLGSAIGGLVLYLAFHHLGWAQITVAYPDLAQSKAWLDATRWVSTYGTWALLGIAATPLPQTPALIFAAVSRLPLAEVFLALFFGKLLKYGVYGLLAAKFPVAFQAILSPPDNRKPSGN